MAAPGSPGAFDQTLAGLDLVDRAVGEVRRFRPERLERVAQARAGTPRDQRARSPRRTRAGEASSIVDLIGESGDQVTEQVSHVKTGRHNRTGTTASRTGELLDIAAAAAYLGVNKTFVRSLVYEKRVRYYKVGRFVRLRTDDLDAFLATGVVDPQPIPTQVQAPSRHSPTT